MCAIACEPGKGSELEVGFRALLAAASRHEVWVLTNSATIPIVRDAISGYAWADRVHLEGIYFDVDDDMYPQLSAPGFHRYYDRWQRDVAKRAVELDERIDFDVVHHVTLAASWTRTAAAALDKPLVWGPVGGGVEMPGVLLRELGWRGLIDETARFVGRRVLSRVGPAHRAQQRAVVIFAQNTDTARSIRRDRQVRLLPNATSVDLQHVKIEGPRRCDILFAARLIPWKGGRLAVRVLRHVQHPGVVLRIFGDGPDRQRIARAAKQWGVAGRVRFEGRVPRDELLQQMGSAGVFLHTAFHDEAGLAVAEALSLGTPVVCLDWGGPSELLRHWPDSSAQAIRPRAPETTARAMAAAIDRFLAHPPPVLSSARPASTSFADHLLAAYDVAYTIGREGGRHANNIWGFPAGKPQVFAGTARHLSKGIMVYGFGRRLPRLLHVALAWLIRIPLMRRAVAEKRAEPAPACGWTAWNVIKNEVQQRNGQGSLEWIHFRSQWGKARSSMLGLAKDGTPYCFLVIDSVDHKPARASSCGSFRVPEHIATFSYQGWSARQYEPLPTFHRPAKWDAVRIQRVAEDVSVVLERMLDRPGGIPAHWRPMHGDFVPWNLREDDSSQLWLLDWEDTGWGPPHTDIVRYIVAYHSMGRSSPARIAGIVRRTLADEPPDVLREVARFWLEHANLQPDRSERAATRLRAKDMARAAHEIATFNVLLSAR
jgi:glycosyltransferase involved in cell wall biosynthesis